MQKIKIIVNGNVPSKTEINSKQNFNKVLKDFYKLKPAILVNPWFYGIVGFASFFLIFFVK
jgi:hypothetical protein